MKHPPVRMTGEALGTALRVLKLSQCQFARDCFVNDRTVRRWISGHTRVPPWIVTKVRGLLDRTGKGAA